MLLSPADVAAVTTSRTAELTHRLGQRLAALIALETEYHVRPPTPAATFAFEQHVADLLRETGREVIEHAYNHAELVTEECPPRVRFGRETYRRRAKTPNTLGTLFGPIPLRRCAYECLEPGEPCIWPLELRLGVVAGLATPALAIAFSAMTFSGSTSVSQGRSVSPFHWAFFAFSYSLFSAGRSPLS